MRTHRSLFILFVATVLAIFLSACGVAYNANRSKLLSTATEADYGPPPPDNHQDIEARAVLATLKDPESARFQFGGVSRDAIPSGPMSPTAMLVWVTFAQVNAKNSYGGYTGFQPWRFAWTNGRIVAVAPPMIMRGGEVVDGWWQYLK